MRNTYIIAYDIADDKRRTKSHKILKGHGDALQYSLFRCELSKAELVTLQTRLWDILNLSQDRLVVLDLGPMTGRSHLAIETWGRPLDEPTQTGDAIIV